MTAPTDADLIECLRLQCGPKNRQSLAASRLEALQAELAAKNTAGEACMTALAAALERKRKLKLHVDGLERCLTARDTELAKLLNENAALRADAERMRAKLLIFAVSKYSCRCYLCDTGWSEGAPDIHASDCLLARDGHTIDAASGKGECGPVSSLSPDLMQGEWCHKCNGFKA